MGEGCPTLDAMLIHIARLQTNRLHRSTASQARYGQALAGALRSMRIRLSVLGVRYRHTALISRLQLLDAPPLGPAVQWELFRPRQRAGVEDDY